MAQQTNADEFKNCCRLVGEFIEDILFVYLFEIALLILLNFILWKPPKTLKPLVNRLLRIGFAIFFFNAQRQPIRGRHRR
jgi:hypothetical protein